MSTCRWYDVRKQALVGYLAIIYLAVPTWGQDGKTIFGDSRTQTLKAMREIVKAVGVKKQGGCLFCHVKEKGKMNFTVDTPHKRVVRTMKASFLDSLAAKGHAEVTIDEEEEGKIHITADYRSEGEKPGIHLSATVTKTVVDLQAGGPKPATSTYSAVLPLPEKGAAVTCMTCHNGELHFLTKPESK
jgi:hypothetical protein